VGDTRHETRDNSRLPFRRAVTPHRRCEVRIHNRYTRTVPPTIHSWEPQLPLKVPVRSPRRVALEPKRYATRPAPLCPVNGARPPKRGLLIVGLQSVSRRLRVTACRPRARASDGRDYGADGEERRWLPPDLLTRGAEAADPAACARACACDKTRPARPFIYAPQPRFISAWRRSGAIQYIL